MPRAAVTRRRRARGGTSRESRRRHASGLEGRGRPTFTAGSRETHAPQRTQDRRAVVPHGGFIQRTETSRARRGRGRRSEEHFR